MFEHYKKHSLIPDDYDIKLRKTFSDLGNIFLDETADYAESMMKADYIISDTTSLLVEFLYCNKIVLYTDKTKQFNPIGKKIASAFYDTKNWTSVERCLNLLLNDIDPKKEKRQKVRSELFSDSKTSVSEKITSIITKDWEKS